MPIEYEHNFHNFEKNAIIKKLKLFNAKKKGIFLFKVQVLKLKDGKEGSYLRVRDEGFRKTMTYKYYDNKTNFADEHEVVIDNFDNGINILLGVGCEKKYYYEKIREIWNLDDSEIIFDSIPGLPDIMEIESRTQKELKKMVKVFELDIKEEKTSNYLSLYEIDLNMTELKFTNVKKELLHLIKKNKELFEKIIIKQIKTYNKIIL